MKLAVLMADLSDGAFFVWRSLGTVLKDFNNATLSVVMATHSACLVA